MITTQLVDYIRKQQLSGHQTEEIKKALSVGGWSQEDIEAGFSQALTPVIPNTAPMAIPEPPVLPVGSVTAPPILQNTPVTPGSVSEQVTIAESKSSFFKTKAAVIAGAVVVVLLIGSAGAYAYTRGLFPFSLFSKAPYTEKNLISGILHSFSKIDSSTYSISGGLSVVPREEGAMPFSPDTSDVEKQEELYERDVTRIRDISGIRSALHRYAEDRSGTYPRTLAELPVTPYSKMSKTDPSGKSYEYHLVNLDDRVGTGYEITTTLESKIARSTLRSMSRRFGTSTIEGMTATFTEESGNYLYIPSRMPEPFFVTMAEYSRFLPADMSASLMFTATTSWETEEGADWYWNLDAKGDFGDLAYKVNFDALKKDTTYYFRINNMPALFFLEDFATYKGKWVKIDANEAGKNASSSLYGRGDMIAEIAEELPEAEAKYKENRADTVEFLKAIAEVADNEGVYRFASEPTLVTEGGERLYRYELKLRKEAIVPFYERMAEESQKHEVVARSDLFNDPGLIEYLKSEEFSKVFEYYNENTSLVLLVDRDGMLRSLSSRMRIVPPDTATQLAEKQAELVITLKNDNINDGAKIEPPEGAEDLADIIAKAEDNQHGSRAKGIDAAIKSNLGSSRAIAELYYDENSGYTSVCTSGTNNISSIAEEIREISKRPVNCADSAKAWAMEAQLKTSGKYYCADSTGAMTTETASTISEAKGDYSCGI